MPNYAKVVAMIKKEFPEITPQEIDKMISQIPPNMPTMAIRPLLKLAKVCCNDTSKLDKLKNTSAKEFIAKENPSIDVSPSWNEEA